MHKLPLWQQHLAESVTSLTELLSLLNLPADAVDASTKAAQTFALRVPRGFIARMQPSNLRDPLLLQVLPQTQELRSIEGYSNDPLQEKTANKIPGLLHKYRGRVLLILSGACAINCRYCFRRTFPYADNPFNFSHALAYIQQDTSIFEVILSGGDPLIVKDSRLKSLIEDVAAIPHIKYLRIHTRLPIMIPARITETLVQSLANSRLHCSLVIHCNHPQEIDTSVSAALKKLHQAGIHLFNQAVLLKGINDNARILAELSHKLFAQGVLPYYLHVLDRVNGTAHFEVDEITAQSIMHQLQDTLPGYLVPKLVREIAGAQSKIPV